MVHTVFDPTSQEQIIHIRRNVTIEDIAFGLSRLVRFNGHCGPTLRAQPRKGLSRLLAPLRGLVGRREEDKVYTVAEHSVIASHLASPEFQYETLMHDKHESIFGDMWAPLKRNCPTYTERIDLFERHILAPTFKTPPTMSPEVKEIDFRLLWTEALAMCAEPKASWFDGHEPEPYEGVTFQYLTPSQAYKAFMTRYEELRPRG